MGHGKKVVKVSGLSLPCLVTPEDAERIRARVVVLEPGEEVGDHVTELREELLVPLEGVATVKGPEGEQEIGPGQALYIPEGIRHNVMNRTGQSIR